MVKSNYVPEKGDLVWLDFDPQADHEQKGRRPAICVSHLYPELNALNFQSKTKHCKKVNAKKCKLLWKFNKIYWLKCA